MIEKLSLIVEELENMEYKVEELLNNVDKVYRLKRIVDRMMADLKDYIKYKQLDTVERGDVVVKRSVYVKYKPLNIDEILKKYPLQEYRELYNISLSSKAKKVITDPSLIKKEYIETVRFIEKKKEEEEAVI